MKFNDEDIFIGIDLGGTNLRVALITGQGKLINNLETLIMANEGPAEGLKKILTLISQLIDQTTQPIRAIGVGSTGPLDRERGCIQNPYTLPGWEDVDIVSAIRLQFGVPVALENDADAAALGESWIGGGKDSKRLVMVTIGTGVGTAFILDGKIYRGVKESHPEGGHILIDPNGPACYCGANGCLESLVSGPSIALQANAFYNNSRFLMKNTNGNPNLLDAALVFQGAKNGDPYCRQLVDRVANYIGLGLVTIMMLYLPDCILLSGGVFGSYSLMKETIENVIIRHNVIIPADQVRIDFAKLGQQSGVFGAARAAQLLVNSGGL